MKCKVCGTNNEDYLEYCENCAAPLEPEESAQPRTSYTSGTQSTDAPAANAGAQHSWGFVRAPKWPDPDFSANTVREDDIPSAYINKKRYSASEPVNFFAEDEDEQPQQQPQEPDSGFAAQRSAREVLIDESFGDAGDGFDQARPANVRYADPIDDDYFSYDRSPSPRNTHYRVNRGARSILFWGAAGVLVVLIAVFTIILFSRRSARDTAAVTAGSSQTASTVIASNSKRAFLGGLFSKSPITKPATIEKGQTAEGEEAYIITVYAKKNSTVRFTAGTLVRENPVTNGSLKLRVPAEVWLPDEPIESATVDIYPDIVVLDKDGNEFPVTFEQPIKLALPTIDLTVDSPSSGTVNMPQLEIRGSVSDKTASVFVNDTELSIDESGSFSSMYTLDAVGQYDIVIQAKKPGYQIASKTISVTYELPSGTGGAATPAQPSAGAPADATAIGFANTSDVNIRSEASTSSSIIGKLALNEKVYIIETDSGNGWSKISYNGQALYVSKQYINVVGEIGSIAATAATVNTDNLNMRSGASTSSEILTKLPINTTVSLLKDAGSDWCLIEYNGKIGYVSAIYLTRP